MPLGKTANMKIIHTVGSLGKKTGGGVSFSVYNLLRALHLHGVDVTGYAPNLGDDIFGQDSFIKLTPNDLRFHPLAYSRNLRNVIRNAEADCFHTHALWQDFTPYVIKTARRKNKPCIVSLHGSFMQSAVVSSGFLKRAWWKYVLHPAIEKATCIHATSEQEYEDFRLLGYKNPVAIIPNIFFPPDNAQNYTKVDNKFRVGYLGRLHPHKQIDLLIEAWKQLSYDDGELVIIGHGDEAYTSYLKDIACSHRVNNIKFEGFKEGTEKFMALAQCNMICLPSKSENFAMVVPEALCVGIPVWASTGTPWKILSEMGCGWWRPATIENIKAAIDECKSLKQIQITNMSQSAKLLVSTIYSSKHIAKQMIDTYEWILGRSEKPGFIRV